jgi:5-methylcytosine-specific restriction enzyme subunit McrC
VSNHALLRLEEWRTGEIPGIALSDADRRLVERLAEQAGPRIEIDELKHGLRVKAFSWVGVVRLKQAEIHVVPKLAGEHVGLLQMLEWTSGLDALRPGEREHALAATGARLPDLLAMLFVRATERILRAGVRADYVAREEALSVLRGRLLADRQVRRGHRRIDLLECRFDERTADIFDNQLLLAAAHRCAARTRHEETRRRAGRLRIALGEVCDARGVSLPRRTISYDRLNAHYRGAHELAWLLLEATHGVDDLFQHGATTSFAFLLDMNRLFERFVERLLSAALAQTAKLYFQRPSGSVIRRADTGALYLRQVPDALVRINSLGVTLPVDAKYKRYARRRVDAADIAQTFLYAHGFGPAPGAALPQALIVYPAESDQLEAMPLVVRHAAGQPTAGVKVIGVPIPRALDEASGALETPVLDGLRDAVLAAASKAAG